MPGPAPGPRGRLRGPERWGEGPLRRKVLLPAWVTPTSVFPQCEQFVERHVPQLLALAPWGRDAHTTCQVPAPAAGPGLLSAQSPHSPGSGGTCDASMRFPGLHVEQALASEAEKASGQNGSSLGRSSGPGLAAARLGVGCVHWPVCLVRGSQWVPWASCFLLMSRPAGRWLRAWPGLLGHTRVVGGTRRQVQRCPF